MRYHRLDSGPYLFSVFATIQSNRVSIKKMAMKIGIPFYVILLFILSCTRTNESMANADGTDSFPDRVGDTWLYHVTDTAITNQNIDTIREYDMEVSVVDSIILPGGIRSNIWVYRSPNLTDTNYVVLNADTINFEIFRGPELVVVRRYVEPLQLHQSWEYSSGSVHDVTVDSVADIQVNANRFRAYHIFGYPGRPDEIIDVEEWIANNVGVIKRYYNNSGTTNPFQHHTTWSLVSYHLQ
jgi:hypothetical protein